MEYNKQMGSKIVMGLGNPGSDYDNTYHNVGKMALEAWLAKNPEPIAFRRHGDLFEYAKSDDRIFVRPLVFMNESGLAAREALKTFSAEPTDLLVLHDESDMELGTWRLSFGGSSAGHKGIQSIIDHLHSDQFYRGRIGIRDPHEEKRKKAGDFVLGAMTPDHKSVLQDVFPGLIAEAEAA